MPVAWYRCPCGFMAEATPRFGDSIVSVSHLHRATRADRVSSIVRMEEMPDPVPESEIAKPPMSRLETAMIREPQRQAA